MLLETAPGEITVDVLVDEQGRVMDYEVIHAETQPTRAQMRSLLGNSMLFTQFHPATSFGQPTVGWVGCASAARSLTCRVTLYDG